MEYCRILKFCVVIFLNFRRLYCLVKWLLLSHCSHLDLPIMSTFFVLYSLLHVRPSIWDFFLFAWSTSFRICLQNESGFPGGSDCKASACGSICLQCRTPGFDPWFGKIPWRRKWQPTSVFLPGKFCRQRSLAGYSPWGHKEWGTTEWITLSLFLLFSFFHFQDLNNVVILLFNLIPLYPPSVSPCFFPCALNDVINAKIWAY